jgi:CDP-diacylglycerol pyrophosphatase
LWAVVSEGCVRNQQTSGIPFPCQSVDEEQGFAILGPGGAHFMIVPTRQVAGIESPEITAPDAPNYWEYAWQARSHLNDFLGTELARDEVGLAINSARNRSQDQLHIHVGCIKPDVWSTLQVYERAVRTTGSRLPFAITPGHLYRMLRINDEQFGSANPFQLVADGIPGARDAMASYTIVVAGATFRDGTIGFYVLAERSDANGGGSGEGLLDYDCEVLRGRP